MNNNILRKLNSLNRLGITNFLSLHNEITTSMLSNFTREKKKLIPIADFRTIFK
jgi:hypothetical protein